MKITPQIIKALERAADYYGNTSQVAKAMGIAHSTVFFWMQGKTKSMSGKLWQERIRRVLLPFMNPALQDEQAYIIPPVQDENDANDSCMMHDQPGAIYVADKGMENIAPVVQLADLNLLDPTLEPIEDFLEQHSVGRCRFTQTVPRMGFGINIEFRELCRIAPNLTFLALPGRYPENNSLVVARIQKTGQVVVRRYLREDNKISLLPVLPGKETPISWDMRKSFGYLLWMFPLTEAVADLIAFEEIN